MTTSASPARPRKTAAPKAATPTATPEAAAKPAAPRKPRTTKAAAAAAPVAIAALPLPDREERIRVAAYLRFVARGPAAGDSLQDWVEAEREVDAQAA